MFRKLLAVVATLALPATLVGQARPAPSQAVHPSADKRQGEVVRPATAASPAGDVDHTDAAGEHKDAAGKHNDATGEKDETQGPDAKEGPDVKEGPEADEGPEAKEGPEGPDAKDVQAGHQDGPNVERSEKGEDKQGDNEASKPVAPAASGHNSRVGSHKP
jgi:hypothetical protein